MKNTNLLVITVIYCTLIQRKYQKLKNCFRIRDNAIKPKTQTYNVSSVSQMFASVMEIACILAIVSSCIQHYTHPLQVVEDHHHLHEYADRMTRPKEEP